MSRLKIAISPRFHARFQAAFGFRERTIQYLEQSMAHWVAAQGALPFMIPCLSADSELVASDLNPDDYARAMDGLVLQGGVDISPELYGEVRRPCVATTDLVRDRYELALIKAFHHHRKPILGICRGMQLLNVYFGGTLHQDLIEAGLAEFHLDLNREVQNLHSVRAIPGGLFAQFYKGPLTVNSLHHQGVKVLGSGLRAEVICETDQLVEAFSHTAHPCILGVQWHPEFHDLQGSQATTGLPILEHFLKCATESATTSSR
jgi:gamma-glutamyl-gamma-aminobutyrate hydrolase PuuD